MLLIVEKMSSSTQNELQSEQSMELFRSPADIRTRTMVENAALYVSKNGLESETKIIASYPTDARFNFLRSSADPCHAYYKHKLAEYLAQNQDGATDDSGIKILLAPQDVTTTTIVDRTSRLVSKFGSEFELMVIASNTDDARFNFLRSSADPYHALYQQKLAQYRADPRDTYYQHKLAESISKNQNGATPMDIKIFHAPPDVQTAAIVNKMAFLVSKYGCEFKLMVMASNKNDARFNFLWTSPMDRVHAAFHRKLDQYCLKDHDRVPHVEPYPPPSQFRVQSQKLVLPNLLQFRLLKGMTLEELDTVKVTAQFVAWYGDDFRGDLMERVMTNHQFEFMKPTDYRFAFFNEFVAAYSQVLNPPKYLKDKLRKSAAYLEAILDGFLQLIEWEFIQKHIWLDGGERAMIDWHASVSKDFVTEEENQELPPPELGMMQPPPGTSPLPLSPLHPPKIQQMLDELLPLVPEDQFLARHPVMFSSDSS